MSAEFLSVCIPTRNRSKYLRPLLDGFAEQIQADKLGPEDLKLYISDNASEDETAEVVKAFARRAPQVEYRRNETNIGGDPNILKVRTYAQGRHVWALGDDELLAPKALVNLLRLLRREEPGLVISYSPTYEFELPKPQTLPDYRAFARECLRVNPHALAEHTLISSNIYRADCFDFEDARTNINTYYPHMYALLRPLLRRHASVVLPDFPIIIMREVRAPVVDGAWVGNLDDFWVGYFTWLRDEMQMPELDPRAPSDYARSALLNNMRKHPLRFLRKNWRALFQPSAYRFFYHRVFHRSR